MKKGKITLIGTVVIFFVVNLLKDYLVAYAALFFLLNYRARLFKRAEG